MDDSTERMKKLAHKLRTPLTEVRWNLELFLQRAKDVPEELMELVRAAHTGALTMVEMTTNMEAKGEV
jgi:hypothetical protein